MSLRKITLAAVAVAGSLFASQRADAVLTLSLQSGAVVVTDNGVGDSDATLGRIQNTSTIAGLGVTINIGSSNMPGTTTSADLQITDFSIRNSTPSAIPFNIAITDTGFTMPGASGDNMDFTSAISATFTHGSLSDYLNFQSYADPANAPFGMTVATSPQQYLVLNDPDTYMSTVGTSFVRGTAFSMTSVSNALIAPGASVGFSGTTMAVFSSEQVPEPCSLGAAGIALAGMMLRRRR